MTKLLECPKCHNRLLVRRSDNLYQCVGCEFKRDFSKTRKSSSTGGRTVLWLLISAVLVTFMVRNHDSASTSNVDYQVPASSSVQQNLN